MLLVWLQSWPFSTEHPNGVLFPGISPGLRFPQLPIILCIELRPRGLFLVLVQLMFGVASDITRKLTLKVKVLVFWLLWSFHPLFCSVPWALGAGMFCRCIHWGRAPQFYLLIGCGFFCSGLHLLQRGIKNRKKITTEIVQCPCGPIFCPDFCYLICKIFKIRPSTRLKRQPKYHCQYFNCFFFYLA
jgi:hypothetical protein